MSNKVAISLKKAGKKDAFFLALHKCNGNITEASKLTGISRATLYRLMGEDPAYKARVDEAIAKPEPEKYTNQAVKRAVKSARKEPETEEVTVVIPKLSDFLKRNRDTTKNNMEYTAEMKLALASAVAELYERGMLSIQDCCDSIGISHKTFWGWRTKGQHGYSEAVALRWEEAEIYLMSYKSEIIINNCRNSLELLTKERDIEEVSRTGRLQKVTDPVTGVETEEIIPYEVKKSIKKIQPNMTAIMVALNRLDILFQQAGLKPKDDEGDNLDRYTLRGMSDEDIVREEKRYQALLQQTR